MEEVLRSNTLKLTRLPSLAAGQKLWHRSLMATLNILCCRVRAAAAAETRELVTKDGG